MIDLPTDAEVSCSDDTIGIFTYAVSHPVNHQITHLVVQSHLPPHYEYLVPIELVEETTRNMIKLKCTQEEFQQMILFKFEEFIPTEMPRHLSWPYFLAIPGAIPEEANYIAVEHQIIPLGERVVRQGAKVKATDGIIGQVEELLIDSNNMQITHLVLAEPHIIPSNKRGITIPVSLIDHVDEDTVYLKVDRTSVEALATITLPLE